MKKFFTLFLSAAFCGLLCNTGFAQQPAATATFEELELPEAGYYIGAEQVGTKEFKSGGFVFSNTYTWWEEYSYGSWSGFGYAGLTSTEYDAAASYDRNSFTVPAGGGAEASKNYAVGYGSSYSPAAIKLAEGVQAQTMQGAYFICNATQINSIENGDAYISAFTKGDFAEVVATGYLNGEKTGEMKITLADYRFDNEDDFYYLTEWTWFDLSALGTVDSVTFNTHCNQQNQWGEIFPQYICIDNFNSPKPASAATRVWAAAPQLNLYPVPARETLTLSTDATNYNVEVFTLSGRCVMQAKRLSGRQTLQVGALQTGVYMLRLTAANGSTVTKKIIVR